MCTIEYSIGNLSVPTKRLFTKAEKLISSKMSSLKPGIEDQNSFSKRFFVVVYCFSSGNYRIDTSFLFLPNGTFCLELE